MLDEIINYVQSLQRQVEVNVDEQSSSYYSVFPFPWLYVTVYSSYAVK